MCRGLAKIHRPFLRAATGGVVIFPLTARLLHFVRNDVPPRRRSVSHTGDHTGSPLRTRAVLRVIVFSLLFVMLVIVLSLLFAMLVIASAAKQSPKVGKKKTTCRKGKPLFSVRK